MKKYLLILVVLSIGYQLQAQGLLLDGFMQPKGHIVSAFGYSHEFYNTYYVGNRPTQNPNLGTIKTNSLNLYVTGGITDFLNVTVNLPYVAVKPTAGFWSPQQDFQDLSFFVKGRFFQADQMGNGKLSIIGGLGYIVPSSSYIADAPISIGHHAQRLELRLITQYRFENSFFIMAQGGYSHASNVQSDRGFEVDVPNYYDITIRSGGNIGFLYTDIWFSQQNALSGSNIGPGIPFPTNAISFLRSGFNLYGDLPIIANLGLSAGMGFTLNGENIGKSTRISSSLIYRLSYLSKN